MLSASVDPGSCGAQARGSEPGRLQANSKIENSVDTTGSNNWYRSQANSKIENSVDTTGSNNWYRSQYPRSEI
jgi:hypothetical protein